MSVRAFNSGHDIIELIPSNISDVTGQPFTKETPQPSDFMAWVNDKPTGSIKAGQPIVYTSTLNRVINAEVVTDTATGLLTVLVPNYKNRYTYTVTAAELNTAEVNGDFSPGTNIEHHDSVDDDITGYIVNDDGGFIELYYLSGDSANSGGVSIKNETVVIPSLPVSTWTPFPAFTNLTSLIDYEILTATGDVITNSFQIRASGASYEMYSIKSLNNLQIRGIGT